MGPLGAGRSADSATVQQQGMTELSAVNSALDHPLWCYSEESGPGVSDTEPGLRPNTVAHRIDMRGHTSTNIWLRGTWPGTALALWWNLCCVHASCVCACIVYHFKWCTVVELSGGTQWWYTVVVHSGGTQWWYTVVVHSGGTQWWYAVVVHSGGTQWWCTVVVLSRNSACERTCRLVTQE